MAEDPYVYPGAYVLKNKPGIRDDDELQKFEAGETIARLLELQGRAVTGTFNRVHLQRIHKHIFQDVYTWAGQIRTVDIRKDDSTYFARPEFIASFLDDTLSKLDRKGGLVALDVSAFAARAGDLLGDLNAVHPFREGNGRTQQEFLRQLGVRAGHEISWVNVSREDMYRASAVSFATGNSSGLGRLIHTAILAQDRDVVRAAFTQHALDVMRSQSKTLLKSAISERKVTHGSVVSGRVVFASAQHIAIAVSPGAFVVFERSKLSRDVAVDERIKARVTISEIAIEPQARSRTRDRER